MRLSKEQKRILEISHYELRVLCYAMLRFRNKVISAGKPTEDIDDLLCKLL